MHTTQNKKSLVEVNIIRTLACMLVVFLHSASPYTGAINKLPPLYWSIDNIYHSFSRICVPLFIMLSGSLILGKQENYKHFFKKKFTKILIPFIAWLTIYYLWGFISFKNGSIVFELQKLSLKKFIIMIIQGQTYYHLWYLYMLIGLYFATPLIKKLINSFDKFDVRYFFYLWIIFSSIIPFVTGIYKIYFKQTINLAIGVPIVSGYMGYYILGYYLRKRNYYKRTIKVLWFLFTVSSILTTLGTYLISHKANAFKDTFYSYTSPTVIAQSVSMFIILNYYGERYNDSIPAIIKYLLFKFSEISFGIYLIHPLFLDMLKNNYFGFTLHGVKFNPLYAIPATAITTLILSSATCLIINKIPILRCIIGCFSSRKNRLSHNNMSQKHVIDVA